MEKKILLDKQIRDFLAREIILKDIPWFDHLEQRSQTIFDLTTNQILFQNLPWTSEQITSFYRIFMTQLKDTLNSNELSTITITKPIMDGFPEDFFPLVCSPLPLELGDFSFLYHPLKCGLNDSPIFHVYHSNPFNQIKADVNLTAEDLLVLPTVVLTYGFLSKISSKSFTLRLIATKSVEKLVYFVILGRIRYSSSLDDQRDIYVKTERSSSSIAAA